MTRYIALSTTLPNTIAVGVYPTEKEAYSSYLEFARSKYPERYQEVLDYYAENYPGDDILDLVMDVDTWDVIQDILNFTIFNYNQEGDFDPEEWGDWNSGSLYRLTKALLKGEVGNTWR